MTDVTSKPGRPHCAACTRPLSACICRWVSSVPSAVQLLILQHPMEVANAKGSARLLNMSVKRSRMLVGEQFASADLAAALHAGGFTPVLLYPETSGIAPAPPLDASLIQNPERIRLVILDGTWRKSRKMLHLNPALHALPRLALSEVPASHYLIRKAHAAHQLSTLEATCYALGQLHGDPDRFSPLIASFDAFVAHFRATSGKLAESTT